MEVNLHKKQFQDLVVTLMVNGYHLNSVIRLSPLCTIINVYRHDLFTAQIRYSILLTDSGVSNAISMRFNREASIYNSTKFGIGHILSDEFTWYSSDSFYQKLGGQVSNGLILNSNLPSLMHQLGINEVPFGIEGKADELLEQYAKECLQYLLKVPVRRYGIDRAFESLPDGIVVGKDFLLMLFDAKAYSNGFSFKSDDINRFEKYINDFKSKYGHLFPQVNAFLVISGKFTDSDASIQARSNELISRCQTPISCIEAKELGEIVYLFLENPDYRRSLNWKRAFTNIKVKFREIEKELKKIKEDNIIN